MKKCHSHDNLCFTTHLKVEQIINMKATIQNSMFRYNKIVYLIKSMITNSRTVNKVLQIFVMIPGQVIVYISQ